MKTTLKYSVLAGLMVGVPAMAHAQDFLSIGSCPVPCTAYTWSAGIASVINSNVPGVQVAAEETQGFVANIALMQNGELEAAMATSLSAYEAYTATGNYVGTEPGKVMAWMSIAPVAMHIITLADGPVATIDDLKGKRVGMGQPGGVSMLDANIMMDRIAGDDFEPFRIRLGDMVDSLADGNLDAALWSGAFPLAPLIGLSARRDVKLLPVPDDFFGKLQADYPPYFQLAIPAGTYDGQTEAVSTYGLSQGLIVSADVSEERVYQMTKAVLENLDELAGIHPAFAKVSLDTILDGFGSPLHPGALRYYREVGVPGLEDFVARTTR